MRNFFDFDDGDNCFSLSDNMAIDSDGDLMMKMSDNMSMDMKSGDLHFTSNWDEKEW